MCLVGITIDEVLDFANKKEHFLKKFLIFFMLLGMFLLSITSNGYCNQAVATVSDQTQLDPFWSTTSPKKGANFFNQKELRERFIAARQLGLTWVRLTPSKWPSSVKGAKAGDFLIGAKEKYQGLIKADLAYLKNILAIAEEENIKVVLTFLDVPGSRWRQHNAGIQEMRIWENFDVQNESLQFFNDLVIQLKDCKALVGLNPINEPAPEKGKIPLTDWYQGNYLQWYEKIKNSPQDLNYYYQRLVKNIRKRNATLPIILDVGYYATPWALKIMQPIDDANVLYAFHFYEPYLYTFQKGDYSYPGIIPVGEDEKNRTSEYWNEQKVRAFLQPIRDWQRENKIADSKIIVGEFGVFRDAPGASQYLKDIIKILNEYHWHWAFYSFREDVFPKMDYELGTAKKVPYLYWDFIEKGVMPNYAAMKDKSLINIIKEGLQTESKPLSPAMGWNSWNWFGSNIDENLARATIDAFSKFGLKAAGYNYIVLDGGWRKSELEKNGELLADPKKFPHGIKPIADYAHQNGLKLGLHIVAGTHDCAGQQTGSKDREKLHLQQLLSWGVDFIKLDKCGMNNSEDWSENTAHSPYHEWGRLLKPYANKILLSLSFYQYQDWYPQLGMLGRTTMDIKPKIFGGATFDAATTGEFLSIMDIAEENNKYAAKAGQGYWNDPDMLVIGDEHLSLEEQKAHFALWCIMTAPLMLGNDLRNMKNETTEIILNKIAIAINQDPLEQGRRIKQEGSSEIWAKHLSDGSVAVLLLNRDTNKASNISLSAKDMGMVTKIAVYDIYKKVSLGTYDDAFSALIKPHSGLFIKINPIL